MATMEPIVSPITRNYTNLKHESDYTLRASNYKEQDGSPKFIKNIELQSSPKDLKVIEESYTSKHSFIDK